MLGYTYMLILFNVVETECAFCDKGPQAEGGTEHQRNSTHGNQMAAIR